MSNSTKVFVTGAVHMAGTANKGTGDKYDFGTVTYLAPAQSFSNAHCTRTSAGFEPTTVNVSDKSIVLRLQSVLDSPKELNLELAPDPLNVQRNVCVGFSEITPPLTEKTDPLKNFKPTGTV